MGQDTDYYDDINVSPSPDGCADGCIMIIVVVFVIAAVAFLALLSDRVSNDDKGEAKCKCRECKC